MLKGHPIFDVKLGDKEVVKESESWGLFVFILLSSTQIFHPLIDLNNLNFAPWLERKNVQLCVYPLWNITFIQKAVLFVSLKMLI